MKKKVFKYKKIVNHHFLIIPKVLQIFQNKLLDKKVREKVS